MNEIGEVQKEIAQTVPKTQEAEKKPLDAILVFGQGPVLNKESKAKAQDATTESGQEGVNFWAESLAKATSILYKKGQIREILIMGGKTGGEVYASEAALIKKMMVADGVPESAIKTEDRSTNTLTNIVNVLNDYLDKEGSQYRNLGILTANYHLPRTEFLMQLFNIHCQNAFSAEEILRYAAREGEEWDDKALLELERRLDMNSSMTVRSQSELNLGQKGYYGEKEGTEQKQIHLRAQEEDVFTRSLMEIPEYWLCYLKGLNNVGRIREILGQLDQNMLKEKFNIDLSSNSDEEIKQRLPDVSQRKMPDMVAWTGQDWSEETKAKLDKKIEERTAS